MRSHRYRSRPVAAGSRCSGTQLHAADTPTATAPTLSGWYEKAMADVNSDAGKQGTGSLTPITLRGSIVTLEPLTARHINDLNKAAAEDRTSYDFTYVPSDKEAMSRYVDGALAAHTRGVALPFAVRHLTQGTIVGSTRFLDLQRFVWPPPWPPGATDTPTPSDANPPTVAEIGSTWYAASAQRTGVNSETKYLLLKHAFETWHTIRVTLKTDARNLRSRTAILRLGATFEGIRHRHAPAIDGAVRDTAYYAILSEDWPAIRSTLEARMTERGWAPRP